MSKETKGVIHIELEGHKLLLAEFRDQLIEEVGSVTWTMTREQFRKKVTVAVDRVIQRVRDAAR